MQIPFVVIMATITMFFPQLTGSSNNTVTTTETQSTKEWIYDIVTLKGWLAPLPPPAFAQKSNAASSTSSFVVTATSTVTEFISITVIRIAVSTTIETTTSTKAVAVPTITITAVSDSWSLPKLRLQVPYFLSFFNSLHWPFHCLFILFLYHFYHTKKNLFKSTAVNHLNEQLELLLARLNSLTEGGSIEKQKVENNDLNQTSAVDDRRLAQTEALLRDLELAKREAEKDRAKARLAGNETKQARVEAEIAKNDAKKAYDEAQAARAEANEAPIKENQANIRATEAERALGKVREQLERLTTANLELQNDLTVAKAALDHETACKHVARNPTRTETPVINHITVLHEAAIETVPSNRCLSEETLLATLEAEAIDTTSEVGNQETYEPAISDTRMASVTNITGITKNNNLSPVLESVVQHLIQDCRTVAEGKVIEEMPSAEEVKNEELLAGDQLQFKKSLVHQSVVGRSIPDKTAPQAMDSAIQSRVTEEEFADRICDLDDIQKAVAEEQPSPISIQPVSPANATDEKEEVSCVSSKKDDDESGSEVSSLIPLEITSKETDSEAPFRKSQTIGDSSKDEHCGLISLKLEKLPPPTEAPRGLVFLFQKHNSISEGNKGSGQSDNRTRDIASGRPVFDAFRDWRQTTHDEDEDDCNDEDADDRKCRAPIVTEAEYRVPSPVKDMEDLEVRLRGCGLSVPDPTSIDTIEVEQVCTSQSTTSAVETSSTMAENAESTEQPDSIHPATLVNPLKTSHAQLVIETTIASSTQDIPMKEPSTESSHEPAIETEKPDVVEQDKHMHDLSCEDEQETRAKGLLDGQIEHKDDQKGLDVVSGSEKCIDEDKQLANVDSEMKDQLEPSGPSEIKNEADLDMPDQPDQPPKSQNLKEEVMNDVEESISMEVASEPFNIFLEHDLDLEAWEKQPLCFHGDGMDIEPPKIEESIDTVLLDGPPLSSFGLDLTSTSEEAQIPGIGNFIDPALLTDFSQQSFDSMVASLPVHQTQQVASNEFFSFTDMLNAPYVEDGDSLPVQHTHQAASNEFFSFTDTLNEPYIEDEDPADEDSQDEESEDDDCEHEPDDGIFDYFSEAVSHTYSDDRYHYDDDRSGGYNGGGYRYVNESEDLTGYEEFLGTIDEHPNPDNQNLQIFDAQQQSYLAPTSGYQPAELTPLEPDEQELLESLFDFEAARTENKDLQQDHSSGLQDLSGSISANETQIQTDLDAKTSEYAHRPVYGDPNQINNSQQNPRFGETGPWVSQSADENIFLPALNSEALELPVNPNYSADPQAYDLLPSSTGLTAHGTPDELFGPILPGLFVISPEYTPNAYTYAKTRPSIEPNRVPASQPLYSPAKTQGKAVDHVKVHRALMSSVIARPDDSDDESDAETVIYVGDEPEVKKKKSTTFSTVQDRPMLKPKGRLSRGSLVTQETVAQPAFPTVSPDISSIWEFEKNPHPSDL